MNEKEIKRLFEQAGMSLQAIFGYFRLKNKVLWSSSTEWASGTKTIKDISKYQTLIADISLGGGQMIMYRRSDTVYWGSAVVDYPTWFATFACTLTLSGDKATIGNTYWLSHNQSSSHGAVNKTSGIKKIVGLDPIVPNNLQEIVSRGGVLRNKKRWCAV